MKKKTNLLYASYSMYINEKDVFIKGIGNDVINNMKIGLFFYNLGSKNTI